MVNLTCFNRSSLQTHRLQQHISCTSWLTEAYKIVDLHHVYDHFDPFNRRSKCILSCLCSFPWVISLWVRISRLFVYNKKKFARRERSLRKRSPTGHDLSGELYVRFAWFSPTTISTLKVKENVQIIKHNRNGLLSVKRDKFLTRNLWRKVHFLLRFPRQTSPKACFCHETS